MPIAPRIKSTIAAVPIHIIRISFFSVFGSSVIDSSSFGRTGLRSPQATEPSGGVKRFHLSRTGRARILRFITFLPRERQSSRLNCPGGPHLVLRQHLGLQRLGFALPGIDVREPPARWRRGRHSRRGSCRRARARGSGGMSWLPSLAMVRLPLHRRDREWRSPA
jgi:hypothetical protein